MIDSYLADCKAENITPEKPYKGSLNIRIGADVHRALVSLAQDKEITINSFIKEILSQYVKGSLVNITDYCPKIIQKET